MPNMPAGLPHPGGSNPRLNSYQFIMILHVVKAPTACTDPDDPVGLGRIKAKERRTNRTAPLSLLGVM